MNLLDLILILALVSGILGGLQLGLVARVASWAGLALGFIAAVVLIRPLLRTVGQGSAVVRLFLTLLIFAVVTGLGSSLGQRLGYRLRHAMPRPIIPLDRAAGAVAGGLVVLVIVWLLSPIAAEVPGAVAQQVRNSAIVDVVEDAAPRPPQLVLALRGLVARTRFPEVFSGLRPAPETGPPPGALPLTPEEAAAVQASSVAVESVACGGIHEGSGWVVAEGQVVTNAHVVAGTEDLQVRLPQGGTLAATVTVFDEQRDLALLDVPELTAPPLPVASAPPGAEGAVVGYPGGQDTARIAPAAIRDERTAVGRDIYGREQTERRILVLAAALAQGDSGAAVVDADGRVVGVAFAIAADRSTTAYALDDTEVAAFLQSPRGEGAGPCL